MTLLKIALGNAVALLALSACVEGSQGGARTVAGASFSLNDQEAAMADRAEEAQPPPGTPQRCQFWKGVSQRAANVSPALAAWALAKVDESCQGPGRGGECTVRIATRIQGNVALASLTCGSRHVEGAQLWLSSPLTHPDPNSVLKQAQIPATTDREGRAQFDLSGVHADAYFGGISEANIYFTGSFESGTAWQMYSDFTCDGVAHQAGNTCQSVVNLQDFPLYPSWSEQAKAAKQAQSAASDDARNALDGECSGGNGDSCLKLAWSYGLSGAASSGATRQQDYAAQQRYYRKACDLKVKAACTHIEAENEARTQTDASAVQPTLTREISNTHPLQLPVTVLPGQTISASFTTSQSNARLSCDFRTLGQTNQRMFDHANGGQGRPCNVAVTNKGVFGINVVLVCATNYIGHRIRIQGVIERR